MPGSDILKEVSSKTEEHEFFTPVPDGYEKGKAKYIITFGTVISGLGKGIFSSSLAKLLQSKGFKIQPIKLEGYLNVDSGTLNPFRHGEVFVLDDGLECDMDLGTYERYLDLDLSKSNFMTAGRLFTHILSKERKGSYLGRDVQFVPHVTGEIKRMLRKLAMGSDIVVVEIGGTVGDIENQYYIEAMRELAYEEGKENVCFCCLTYVLEPTSLGEQKSKAAQQGIRTLLSMGVQPDIVVCRSEKPVTEKVREKLSLFSNVPMSNVVSMHNCDSIYEIPLMIRDADIDKVVMRLFGLKTKSPAREKRELAQWEDFIRQVRSPKGKVVVGITGKYTWLRDAYASIIKALEHSAAKLRLEVELRWIETSELEGNPKLLKEELEQVCGIIVPGGFGRRGVEGKINCIEFARKNNIPYLGLCLGFQMAVIEFARNACGIQGATSEEFDPSAKHQVISLLPEQKKLEGLGGTMRLGGRDILVKKGSRAHAIYGKTMIHERFRHRYEVDPAYIKRLVSKGMRFSGKAPKYRIMQILELPNHPFFIGTQFHPEFTSRPLRPHPLFTGFLNACSKRKDL